MTRRPSEAMGVLNDQSPPAGSAASAHDLELLLTRVHHQAESRALSVADPGPAGFDFALPDDDAGAEALWAMARGFMWRKAVMKDGW